MKSTIQLKNNVPFFACPCQCSWDSFFAHVSIICVYIYIHIYMRVCVCVYSLNLYIGVKQPLSILPCTRVLISMTDVMELTNYETFNSAHGRAFSNV